MDQAGPLVLREAGVSCSDMIGFTFIGKINLQELTYFTLFDKEK